MTLAEILDDGLVGEEVARLLLGELAGRATLTVEETAEVLRCGRNSAYDAIHAGVIPSLRIGQRILVPVPALLRRLSALPDESPP